MVMDIKPSVDIYDIEIEAISPISVGGGEESIYESYEYFINSDEGKIYFVTIDDLLNLYNMGIVKEEDFDSEYDKFIDKILQMPDVKKYLRSIKLTSKADNKLRLYKFAKAKEINLEKQILEEKPVIFGSTLKGLLRTGYLANKIKKCEYQFSRSNNRLKLENAKVNNIKVFDNKVHQELFNISDYDISLNLGGTVGEEEYWVTLEEYKEKAKNNLTDTDILNAIFRNIVCSDLEFKNGEVAAEKVVKFNRKNKKFKATIEGIPLYFEVAQSGSKFAGEVRYKNNTENYDKQLSIISIQNRNQNGEDTFLNPVEECFNGLKKMSRYIIKAEYKILKEAFSDNRLEEFYRMLEEENEKEDQFVFKIGYSGILAKTLMAFDEKNVENNDSYLPYTINITESTKLPMGWIKVIHKDRSNDEYET